MDPAGDLVSSALAAARIGGAGARWFGGSGEWGGRFESFEGIGFHAVSAGSAWLIDTADRAVRLNTGDVVVVPNGAAHAISLVRRPLREVPLLPMGPQAPVTGDHDLECLCGAYRLAHGQVHQYLRNLPGLLVVPVGRPEIDSLVGLLTGDVREQGPGTGVTRTALIDLVLVHALRAWHERGPAPVGDAQVQLALSAIDEAPHHPWTVQRLSARAGLSRTVFSRRFAAEVGQSPMAYLTGRRMARAAQLLTRTDAPLAAVAGQVGYSGEFAFANAFRREFGVAPGRYRRNHRALLAGE
ncbi:AraC family transcriptional regulator [Kineosporia sp. J2-2]|uniref:AraC family transcriptional regulator n=1 Tax=Kineosporia corallincola TaxID=2835133 RepID=A0ABS5TG52_9ACTN|nr:AraC family transcriptional regulator [Kineosporia corallincola]MBT0770073.1 AraC family transcriptional regulator [Kineosporia corallincola]